MTKSMLKLYLPICLVDDGLDMHSSIYDSIRAIQYDSVVFWVERSTQYQGASFLLFTAKSGTSNIFCLQIDTVDVDILTKINF